MTDRDKVVRELADALRGMNGDGSQGTICHLPFEGVVGLIQRAYDAGRAEGYAEGQRAERADVVAWLRSDGWHRGGACPALADNIAFVIERGAHQRK